VTASKGLPLNRTHFPNATMKCVSNSTQALWARDGPAPTVGPSVGIHGRALGLGGRVGERQNERVLADESHLLADLLREGPA